MPSTEEFVEQGDPSDRPEKNRVDIVAAQRLVEDRKISTKGPLKLNRTFALHMIEVAEAYVGVTRKTDPNQILEFVRPWGYKTVEVPFCAMGVAFAACQSYWELPPPTSTSTKDIVVRVKLTLPDINEHYFKPSPSCELMRQEAIKRNQWIPHGPLAHNKISWDKILPGWLVLYNWGKHTSGSVAQHVGIVKEATKEGLHTVEFNTKSGNRSNGGAVARRNPRERPFRYVLGFIKTY